MFGVSSRSWLVIALLIIVPGCDDESGGDINGPEEFTVENFVDRVLSADLTREGTVSDGDAPAASGGPSVAVSGNATVIWGGSTRVDLSAAGDFTTVIVSVDGISGHYRLDVPATSELSLVLTMPRAIPQTSYDIEYRLIDEDGSVGQPTATTTEVVVVEPSEVQISVSWDSNADIDLHVVEPGGTEIYWAHPAASGGELVLTSNENCVDGPRNESVAWVRNAPRGDYTVRVAMASGCGSTETEYVVTVRMQGRKERVFTGTLTDPTGTGEGDGEHVTTEFF